jgi:ribosome-associated protein YbcJ (S4-like RNA binding protein)
MQAVAFHPKWKSMKSVSQCHAPATMTTGGAAKWVESPADRDVNKKQTQRRVAQVHGGIQRVEFPASSSAQIVIAAGSVINEPRRGPIVRIANHQAAGDPPPNRANRSSAPSANWRIGASSQQSP